MAALGQPPKAQFFDGDGVPLYGGKVYTYSQYLEFPIETYTDPTKTSYNSNPVILDSRGEAGIWFDPAHIKIVVYSADDVLVDTIDAYPPAPAAKATFYDDAGSPLVGGKVYSYAAGTSLKLDTYTDATETTSNTNPVILDADGQADLWFGSSLYKIVLKTSKDVEIYTVDNYGT